MRVCALPVFKTGAFSRSATSPAYFDRNVDRNRRNHYDTAVLNGIQRPRRNPQAWLAPESTFRSPAKPSTASVFTRRRIASTSTITATNKSISGRGTRQARPTSDCAATPSRSPRKTRRTPCDVPPDVFRRLLAQCDVWAASDPEEFDKSTQSGRAKRLQALRKRREGRQMRVILELTINCGSNAVDCERIQWSDLKRDGPTPHMDFPRRKTEHSTGKPTDRRTPLLPQVVDSLKSWRAAPSRCRAKDSHSTWIRFWGAGQRPAGAG